MSIENHFEPVKQTLAGNKTRKELLEGVLFSLPYLLLFCVFLLYPLVMGGYMSLHDWNAFRPAESEFIGLTNYVEMFGDPLFWTALWNTLYWVVLTVPTMVVLSLGLALGINRDVKGKNVLRTIFFSPYILTVSVAALTWIELYSPRYGPINHYLEATLSISPSWLQSKLLAMPAMALMTLWLLVGFNFIVLLAARQNIPEYLYEAARLDGATSWRALKDITLPQLRSAIFFIVITNLIWAFKVFGQPYIMTRGGPGQSTYTLVMYLYQAAFSQQEFGYAAAIGYVLTGVLVLISIMNYFFIGSNDE